MALFESPVPNALVTDVAVPLVKGTIHAIHEAYTHARPTVIQSDCSALVQGLRSTAEDAEEVGVPKADVNACLTEAANTVEDLATIAGRGKSRGVLTSLRLLWGKKKLQSLSDRIKILQATQKMLNEAREWRALTSLRDRLRPRTAEQVPQRPCDSNTFPANESHWEMADRSTVDTASTVRSASTAEVSLETVGTATDSNKNSENTSEPCKVFEVDMVCELTKTIVTAVTEGSSSA
ncbi:hypothetical protein DACRYDRAFT_111408 [Dacryopinax primogenitus]|uniref:Uncharacterized protein n=1 Tax=Dacryopinax primogenitus (strain DJM 731) TaxID=1858805 RepID=M5FQQ4_DACPD|nr:uncharacterized protein DACRYDRAFT_111408 [Dacryopinax primogenitus]EJT97888.1 hypothetical protein DACRYDRAFT_111408 [Dacryopinax primogenitus]